MADNISIVMTMKIDIDARRTAPDSLHSSSSRRPRRSWGMVRFYKDADILFSGHIVSRSWSRRASISLMRPSRRSRGE